MPWPIPELPAYPDPAPLQWYRWALLLAGLVLTAVVLVLLNVPSTMSTRTPDVWLLMFGAPTLVFVFLFGLRLSVFEREKIHQDVWIARCRGLRQAWTQWSQRHHVVTHAVVLAPVANDIGAWFDPDTPLPMNPGRSVTLKWTDALTAEQWLAQVFRTVADAMAPSLHARRGALAVHVMLDTATHQALDGHASTIGMPLSAALAKHAVHLDITTNLHAEPGLREWDAWLDRSFDTPVLLMAAQRAADPDAPTFSEGAMAMLFDATHPRNTRQAKTVTGVRVYRTMPSTADTLVADLADARRVQSPQASHAWLTAVDARMQGRLLARGPDDATAPSTPTWHSHKMDDVLGIPGPLSAWIALGRAVQAATFLNHPQLVIAGDGSDTATLCMVAPHDAS